MTPNNRGNVCHTCLKDIEYIFPAVPRNVLTKGGVFMTALFFQEHFLAITSRIQKRLRGRQGLGEDCSYQLGQLITDFVLDRSETFCDSTITSSSASVS